MLHALTKILQAFQSPTLDPVVSKELHASTRFFRLFRAPCCVKRAKVLQEIFGKYLTKQEGRTKCFLRLQVESLRTLPDSSLEAFVRFLEPRKLAETFEVDVRATDPLTNWVQHSTATLA
jgi:hypothetical protein